MRRQMRKLAVVIVLMLGLLGNHSIAYANTSIEEGISVSIETDKTTYEKDEEITIKTIVRNLKGVSIHDFSLENVIPDGFKLTNGTNKALDQEELKPGEEIILSTTIIEGEDNIGLVIGMVSLIVIAVAAGVLFALKKKKQATAIMIILALGISSFGSYGVAIVQAKEEKTLSKESIINYDSKELQFLANIDYKEEVPVRNEADTITKGEWVKLLLEKTETDLINVENGFTYYFSDTKESKYGLAVETAYMRGILPQEESKVFGINEAADREFVAYTVYYIMGFDGEYNLICEDLEEINYVNESALLIQQGFLSLIDDCFMPQNAITDYDKEQILNKIAYFNSSLDIFNMEDICEIEYVDGVVLLETEEYDYTENGEVYTVVLNADVDVSAIKEGTVFIITEKIPYEMSEAFKAVAVYEEDGKITVECTRPHMEEVLEEYKMVGSTFLNPTTIVPEEGVEIEYIPNDTRVASAGRIRIEDSIDSLGTVKFNLAKINVGGKDSGITLQGDFSMEIPEIAFVIEGEGSNLDELTIALSSEEKLTGLKLGWNSAMDEGGRITEEKVKIATFPNIPVAIGASVKVTLYLEFGISGEISLSWSMESLTGMQYKDGAFRTINDTTMSSATSKVEAEMKTGVAPNIALLMFGTWDVAGIDAGIGLAGEVSKTTHTDITPKLECLDAGVYVYLNLKVDEESTLGKLLKAAKVSANKEVWKSTNSPWRATYHIENSEVKDVCTYGKGHIFGSVVNESGKPMQDAKVVISQVNGTYTAEAYTANSESKEYEVGDFSFENVPVGEYKIEVTLGTLYEGSTTVAVESGKRAECWKIVIKDKVASNNETDIPASKPESTPNPTPTPDQGTVFENFKVSSQGYDNASQVSEKYYVVKNGNLYGMVDFYGNSVVPMQYEKYSLVAENEVQFIKGNRAYVYNTDTGRLVIEYVTEEFVESKVIESFTTEMGRKVTVELQNFYYDFEKGASLYRVYQGGILREDLYTWWTYEATEDYYGSSQGHWLSTYKNVYNNTTIYSGYTDCVAADIMCWVGSFSSDKSEGVAVMVETDKLSGAKSLIIINTTGYQRKNITNFDSEGIQASYDNGWLKLFCPGEMIDVHTMKKVAMPFCANYWYYGRGEYYAASTDDNTYSICKGSTILKNGCVSVDFEKENYIIYKRADGKFVYMTYSGTEVLTVNDYGGFVNGRAIVNDGTGIYIIDENLNKVSDYIYKGIVENCHDGAIKLNGKYYLIAEM